MGKKPELLSPAGDWEKLQMAVLYGADAVYLAGTSFGMRSFAGNFDDEALPKAVREAVEIQMKYAGYIARQQKQVEDFQREENRLLPPDADYAAIGGLRVEARQKLNEIRPLSIGQASRISGVSPADIAVLLIWLGQQEQ